MTKTLLTFGVVQNYDEYATKLQNVEQKDIAEFYNQIKENLDQKQVVVVSKNSKIEETIREI